MTPSELPGYLRLLKTRVAEAAAPAANAMGEKYKKNLTGVVLRKYQHAPGTWTTSPPGQPPATVTGKLAGSVVVIRASGSVRATSSVSPHTDYDAVQEYGATIHAKPGLGRKGKRAHTMHFVAEGEHYFPLTVTLPARPYVRPTVAKMCADGSLSRAAAEAFYVTVWARLG